MCPASVYQNGDGAAVHCVQAASLQREALARKILDRRSEIELAVEPGFHRVLVGGDDILEMAGLQRAEMRVHDGGKVRGFGALAAQPRNEPPAPKSSEKKNRSGGQPAPVRRPPDTCDGDRNGRGGV